MALQGASLFGVLNLRDNMTPGLNTALGNAQSFGSSLTTMGNNVSNVGRQMTAAFAPAGAGLAASLVQSNTFSRSLSNINSILGITGDEAATLRAQLLAYGGSTNAGPQAVADAYYSIVSGVADATTHMAILDAATRTSEAGQADLAGTTSALISTMNAYRLGAEDASYVSDVMTRTVQTGVLTMNDLASAFPQVTGMASSMNIGVADLASQLSYMTTQGFSASQSATFLRGMMTTLLNPTTALSSAIQDMGYSSGQAMVDALGLVGAYQAIEDYGDGSFSGLITSQEALQGALALTGEGASAFLTNFATDMEGATEAAREIQNETAGWERFTSQIQQLAIATGDTLAPTLLDLLDNHITPLMGSVSEWITQNPQLASTIAMVTAALVVAGPVIMFVGGILSGIGTIVTVVSGGIALLTPILMGATAAFTAAGGGVAGMGAAVWVVLGPIGIMVLAVGSLVAWLNSREGGLIGSLGELTTTLVQLNALGFHFINQAINNAIGLFNQLSTIIDQVSGKFNTFMDTVSGGNGSAITNALNPMNIIDPFGAIPFVQNQVGNLFGGQRAAGGPVTSGRQYLVGENGPELFTPSTSGNISSNRDTMAMAGAGDGGFQINGNITVIANNPEEFMAQLQQRRRRRQ